MTSQEPLSPEYTAFGECYESVVATIEQDLGEFCVQLFAKGYISKDDRDFISPDKLPSEKARRLAKAVSNRIEQDPKVFHGFLKLDIVNDPSREDFVKKLKENFKSVQSQPSTTVKELKISTDSSPPTEPIVNDYKKFLRDIYKWQAPPSASECLPSPTNKVFKLAMIRNEEVQRGKIDEKFVQMTITGKIDDILKNKTPVEIENIFSEIKDDERRFVLIEGAPGTGKSTLALQMCKKWGKDDLYPEYTAVVLVELGDPRVRDAKSLADLLPCANEAMATEAEAAMIEARGEGVLMILDGWDELPPDLPQDSIVHKLVQPGKSKGSPIPNASIIITSRPTSSAELHPLVSSRIEVLGFTPKELEEYFKECLKGDLKALETLLKRIRLNPVVEGSCYIPFVASMIAHVFISGNGKLPGSNTEIFISLVLFFLSRYLQKSLEKSKQEAALTSLQDLPQPLSDLFNQLCSLAYYGIRNNKVTFVGKDFKSAVVDPKVCDLGLLQAATSILIYRPERYYNYLHLSIQELLAAIHISHMPVSEERSIFKELFDNPRFTAVFQFYAGITKLKACCSIFSRLVKSSEEDRRSMLSDLDKSRDSDNKTRLVSLLRCLYEAEDPSLCVLMANSLYNKQLYLDSITLNPLDCLSVGNFLSTVVVANSGVLKVGLYSCSIGDQGCKLLSRGFSKSLTQNDSAGGQIDLNISYNNIHEEGVQQIIELVKNTSVIRGLDLSLNHIGNNRVKKLCEVLCTNSTLEDLNLAYCSLTLSDDTGPALSQLLSNNHTIKTLNLSGNSCTDCSHLAAGLVHNKTLTTLTLQDCGLTDESVPQLCTGLGNHIKELIIYGNHALTPIGFHHLAQCVTTLSALRLLGLPGHLHSRGRLMFREVNEDRRRNRMNEIYVMWIDRKRNLCNF